MATSTGGVETLVVGVACGEEEASYVTSKLANVTFMFFWMPWFLEGKGSGSGTNHFAW